MAEKRKKQPRPKAEPPRGFRDYAGREVAARQAMLARIAEVYHRYGFDPLETSAIETVEALGKFLPDTDRPNEGVFAFQDEDESWLALRYDLTAPLARYAAQHRQDLPTPYRRYAMGPVWRNEKPGPGRYRQFYQCDADTVGSASPAADAEICMMLADAFAALGFEPGEVLIRLNDRRVLNGVLETLDAVPAGAEAERAALSGADTAVLERNAAILRTMDKHDKVGREGVVALLTEGRRDASGAFIPGVGLDRTAAERVVAFLEARGEDNVATLSRLAEVVGASAVGHEGVEALRAIVALMEAQGYGGRVVVDPSVVRGLGYYTGPVVEAELTFEVTGEDGRPRQFGSVAGGGRYDDLVERFTGQKVPATGVSIGVDRLLAALEATGRADASAAAGPVVILALERDAMAGYQAMCAELRAAGLRAEVFLGSGSMGKQLKYADRRQAPVAVIEGAAEREAGIVQLKDLALGTRLAAEIATREEWAEQPAQRAVPRAELVAAVRAMLGRAPPSAMPDDAISAAIGGDGAGDGATS
ncbi:MAG: histidine--tRNA ligase [Paracoccaceae bacterium]